MSQFKAKQLTIDEIINTGFNFEIADYQRGYCWGATEVSDLLNDISRYFNNCLAIASAIIGGTAFPTC